MKPQARLDGKYVGSKLTAEAKNVPVFILNEDDVTIYYSPVFDITGYGYNDEEAKKSLIVSLNEFFRYTINKDTFDSELVKLGWKLKKKKNYTPPNMSKLIKERDYLSEIIDKHEFRKSTIPIEMPVG